ncbi:Tah11p KNAG_0I00320 [Huiozyma naganishii CBS 8797]|uniref:Uncharacterized protein n=1 Tax=Huiozyma naganishii (strain ATCC MYA-139 / BCRC 22969 / CBS 8797 / KCTC 17520 / NBRC 10181 / NCYC 3082 / Yp74L-3) TaxID=1071383 RepID=J7RPY5_HUIN7|nr:hypothetical protein KNAG_0I00320 [Kazachstania naganishii CBS 8797]CCK71823.1 hypothetical protein KNAG_0I00320 [Kazachstania naganishii CBS 8797]
MAHSSQLPVIDLDKVGDEAQLLPIVRGILTTNDTFLVKNYANRLEVARLLETMREPSVAQGFDANFTGTLALGDDGQPLLEQYIENVSSSTANGGPGLQFDRHCQNGELLKVYHKLLKIVRFFAQLCLQSVGVSGVSLENEYATKLTRFHYDGQSVQEDTDVVDAVDDTFKYYFDSAPQNGGAEYTTHRSAGLLTVFPSTEHVRFKPPTTSIDDNIWCSAVDTQEDCLLFHTGGLLAAWSNGMHATSPLQLDTRSKMVHLTVFPPLDTPWNGSTVANLLLRQQIEEWPQVARAYYPRELAEQQLFKRIKFYKDLFAVCETVVSLYTISRANLVAPELNVLLPQMTNLMKKKITADDFLKMTQLWDDCYILECNSMGELTLKVPRQDPLQQLTNSSRRLTYVSRADEWYAYSITLARIPQDVPSRRINKRRGSSSNSHNNENGIKDSKTRANNMVSTRYLCNNKQQYVTGEKPRDTQNNLLERLREREKKSAILLNERERKYQQFLATKMRQIFDILMSLDAGVPYTETYLCGLIVDSLQDSNNPIGTHEAQEILVKINGVVPNQIRMRAVDGGLKVFKISYLNRDEFLTTLPVN